MCRAKGQQIDAQFKDRRIVLLSSRALRWRRREIYKHNYIIYDTANEEVYHRQCTALEKYIPRLEKLEELHGSLDSCTQKYRYNNKTICVYNDNIIDAVHIGADIPLESVFKSIEIGLVPVGRRMNRTELAKVEIKAIYEDFRKEQDEFYARVGYSGCLDGHLDEDLARKKKYDKKMETLIKKYGLKVGEDEEIIFPSDCEDNR